MRVLQRVPNSMPRHVALLRGVNLVRTNRIAMPELRKALEEDGFAEVRTYVASGNVVLTSSASADTSNSPSNGARGTRTE